MLISKNLDNTGFIIFRNYPIEDKMLNISKNSFVEQKKIIS